MLNKVQLIGNVGHDLELRTTPGGKVFTSFSLATNQRYRDRDGERQTRTDWHRMVLWGAAAVNAGKILGTGSLVYVEGRLQTRSWEDESGAKQYRTEVVGLVWQILGRPGNGDGSAVEADAPEAEPDADAEAAEVEGEDDDIPF